jgi:hypothetical protein
VNVVPKTNSFFAWERIVKRKQVRFMPDCVAKLHKGSLGRKIRIVTGSVLNQRCASKADLESILLVEALQNSFATVSAEERTYRGANVEVRVVPILLQKPLMASANGDSLALTRFAVEADDDGTAES